MYRIFEGPFFRWFFPKTEFKVIYVPGASASGIANVNSLTRAYTIFKAALEEGGYDEIRVTLGKVDAAYALRKRADPHKRLPETILEDIVEKYVQLLLSLSEFAPVTVISASMQTIEGCRGCADDTSRAWGEVDVPIDQRIGMTLAFNHRIKSFCQSQNVNYVNLDPSVLDKNGRLKSWLKNGANPCDHHYHRWMYAWLLVCILFLQRVKR